MGNVFVICAHCKTFMLARVKVYRFTDAGEFIAGKSMAIPDLPAHLQEDALWVNQSPDVDEEKEVMLDGAIALLLKDDLDARFCSKECQYAAG